MLVAVAHLSRLEPAQQAELNVWKTNLDKTHALLAKRLADMHKG